MQIKKNLKICVKLDTEQEIDKLCQDNRLVKQSLYDMNNTHHFTENDVVLIPKQYEKIYVVKPLDTIESIAKALNVDTNRVICATNGKIFVGQKIIF